MESRNNNEVIMEIKFTKKIFIKIIFLAILFSFPISGLLCKEGKIKSSAEKANIHLELDINNLVVEKTGKHTLLIPFQKGEIQTRTSTSKKVESQTEKKIKPKHTKKRNICIKIGANYFSPSEKSFKDIYGGGMAISGEINIKLWKFIDLWLIGNYYSKKGSLPFTKEETKMTLIPIGGGLKIRFQKGAINPYIGLGPVIYVYKETNPIGVAKGTNVGFIGQAGCYFNIVGGLLLDACINYSYCSVKPQKIRSNLGGIQAGIGIGYEF